ncbi:hypothetical protein [Flavobacterium quisquiliarum]|uniref:Uncharacterized protein n=1 Tax=Flavobacterium quisquiliarum TaxID=1834436 RepID=A0ABV8WCA5_9FLAO|nr:hypothetical protein [Flavobacterium quisquiliarum]MBW1658041.1 hypothetical protein [Flavobacterium quisquiliarum]NWK99812.1 hypothetical protein [Flavobacterium collinsii]
MLKDILNNIQKKSLKERFLLVLGILFFLIYLVLGLMIMFWEKLPLNMEWKYRYAFGTLLIVYSGIRFLRLINSKE